MTVRVTREAEPQIELYGAYSGELLGGTQGTRSSLTFTPTDDYLIVVPKNQVNYAQLEEAPTPSSYILTTTSSATRAGETLTIPSANLPWPEPVVIGEELVTNGTFDTDTDWTLGTGWTIGGGAASCDGTQTANTNLTQGDSTTTSEGSVYQVSFDATRSAGSVQLYVRGRGTASITASGSYSYVVAAGISSAEDFTFVASSTFVGTIDNISVKEINPLAVSIAMEGTMTYADLSGIANVVMMDWSNGSGSIEFYLDTRADDTGQLIFRQKDDSGTLDFISGPTDSYSPGINVPFNIASRHGSTFINGAVDGTALTENTTPVALPDLSTTDLNLGFDFMGTIKTFRMWADDISDVGIEEASS